MPAITSRDYVPDENGVVVSTRAPSNLVDCAEGASISIAGEIEMKLAGDRRRLQADVDESEADDAREMTSTFELQVGLLTEVVQKEGDPSANSATTIASGGIAALYSMPILVLAYSM